jgi:hypothetical protein
MHSNIQLKNRWDQVLRTKFEVPGTMATSLASILPPFQLNLLVAEISIIPTRNENQNEL